MGFMHRKHKNKISFYPATRNRITNPTIPPNQQHHPATVINPPSNNYGAHDPAPMPASVYQSNGVPVAPPAAATATATAAAATYNPNAYGAFPDSSAPVQATVYVPGGGVGAAAPVVASAYNPSSAAAARPVQAAVYNPSAPAATAYGAGTQATTATPATNPLYDQGQSFNNGNANYNSDESSYWECSVCTFPNLRTEANCKGCGSPIPPGMLQHSTTSAVAHQTNQIQAAAAAPRPPQDNAYNGMHSQMNQMSLGGAPVASRPPQAAGGGGGGVMRVHIPNGMQPGQKIKVRSPDGKEVVKTIPPQREWHYDGAKPFFRMQFGAQAPPAATSAYGAQTAAHAAAPPTAHVATWRGMYDSAPSQYSAPRLGNKTVPHAPRGMGAGLPPNGRHKSLIIGINYTGSRAALRGCINDAKNMQGLLQRNGYPDDGAHMLLLTDERSRGKEYQPTLQNIMKAFHWFMTDVRKGDILFFHFSGHGGQVPDKTGMEVDGYNETIIPLDYERKGQISDDILWGSLVYRLPEGARITALMDMCHSGTGLDLPYDYNVDRRRWTEDVNPAHSCGDVVLFSGCEDAQTSADVSGGGQAGGAMTQAFMGAYQRAPMSTYHGFLNHVKGELRKKRFSQRPQLTSSQQFDANSRIFSLGYQCGAGGTIPSTIEPNHNPTIGRMKNRHVRAARQGFGGGGGGGGNNLFNMAGAFVGAALVADALF